MKQKKKLVLIGGLDPTGHAGLLADARVMEDLGMSYVIVATALTAQNDTKFFAWEPCSLKIFRQQLQACGKNIWGVKIGMIGDTRLIAPLVQWLARVKPRHVLWDPVFQSSSGGKLISEKKWDRTLEKLLRHTTVWTPNIPEAQWILGRRISSRQEMERTVKNLWKLGKSPHWILLKGGHLPATEKQITDFLSNGKKIYRFTATRRKKNPRGTGCTLASALLANLANDQSVPEALKAARRYLLLYMF